VRLAAAETSVRITPMRRTALLLCVAATACLFSFSSLVAEEAAPSAPQASFSAAEKAGEALPRLRSLLISQRGEPVLERYYGGTRANRAANIKSASKTVMSALIGIAVD